jgi:hypothetical protein
MNNETTFRALLLQTLVHTLITGVVLALIIAFSYLIELMILNPPGQRLTLTNWLVLVLNKWIRIGAISIFCVQTIIDVAISIGYLFKSRDGVEAEPSSAPRSTRSADIFSYIASIIALAVVYGLVSRALATEDPISKLLFCFSASLLFCEVVALGLANAKRRLFGSPSGKVSIPLCAGG